MNPRPARVRLSLANVYSRSKPPRNKLKLQTYFSIQNSAFSISSRGGRRGVPVRRIVVMMLVVMMLDGRRALQVNDRQQHEDEGLQAPGDQPQEHHRQRHQERNDAEEDGDDELLTEDVAEKS